MEDDAPGLPAIPNLGHKFVLGPTPSVRSSLRDPELPEAYGTGKFALTARDPHWLYAHWDLSREQQRQYNARSIHRHLVVRLHAGTLATQPLTEIHVHPESQHWFIHVEKAGITYVGELGYYRAARDWVPVATAATAAAPPDSISTDKTVTFATIHPDARLVHSLGQLEKESPTETGTWTAERERALADIYPALEPMLNEVSSAALAALPGGPEREIAGSSVHGGFQFAAGEEVGGISSVLGGEQQHGFWFNINAELIIYGGTEPGASVTLDGVPIRLHPDGTFSCRFALPDGSYELALAAMSEQGDLRQATLKSSRRTERQGEVGVHPWPPEIKKL